MNIFEAVEGLVSGQLDIVKTLFKMMTLEARLAGQSIAPLMMSLCMLFIVLITTWGLLMTLLTFLLALVCPNIMWALGSVLCLNGIIVIGLLRYLRLTLINMSFEKTRNYFTHKDEGAHHDKLETKIAQ